MKRILLFAIGCMSLIAHADNFNPKKFLEKHDVDNETKNLKSNNPVDFWESFIANNESFQAFMSDAKEGKLKKAQKFISSIPRLDVKYFPYTLDDSVSVKTCDNIHHALGFVPNIEVCILDDASLNAFAAYTYDGMAVALNSGLVDAKGMTPEMIIGIAAHEYAHCWLFHTLQQANADIKRKKRNDIIVGVTAGLSAVASGIDAYNSATLGTPPQDPDSHTQILGNAVRSAAIDEYRNHYKYSRELEYEADLIAYRFLEWSGIGGDNYIEALKLIGSHSFFSATATEKEDDDHPTITNRIQFLNYVKDHPEIGNTLNEKIRKKRLMKNDPALDDIYR